MKPVSDVTALVADKGLFTPVALRLARDCKKVYYYTPAEKAFPTVQECFGDGFPEIHRVRSIWEVKDQCDLFVFPDVGFSYEQEELVSQGLPVWGARRADILELSRGTFLDSLKQVGLKIGPHGKLVGITALRENLRDKHDLWIKISNYRGDWETYHWRSWEEDEIYLDRKAVQFGPFREHINFYVFDPIETKNEDGSDTWCIDGAYPSLVIHGMECKDKAYIGTFQKFDDLPEPIRDVNQRFAPILAQYHYRSFFSSEVRITETGDAYFIDPTCRAGSPPSQVMTEMIGNYSEVIWGGANGEVVEPEPAAKYGVQGLICVPGDRRNDWSVLKVDPELERWVKCPNAIWDDGYLWLPPDPKAEGKDIGWLVGIGDKLDEAIRHLQHNTKLLPDGATCEYSALADLIQQINKAEEQGMEFMPDAVPPPEIVIEND